MSLPRGLPNEGSDPPRHPLHYERRYWRRGLSAVVGVDEVGRGPLAGPVVAAAVILHQDTMVEGAADSKLLDADARKKLAREIAHRAHAVALGAASVREIDRANVLVATAWAMNRALDRLGVRPEHVVVDGLPLKSLRWKHDAIVGGDGSIHSISCASIVAKVCRDRLMRRLAKRYPGYGWDRNAGYATREHRDALDRIGATPHHRQSFLGLQYDLDL